MIGLVGASLLESPSAAAQPTKSGTASPAAGAGQTGSDEEVKRLFGEGQAAADKKQWQKARDAFAKAFEMRPLPQIAVNLGRAEVRLGKPEEVLSGATHLQLFLREETGPEPADVQAVQALLKEAKAKLATITMKVDVADAEVLVDGRAIDKKQLPGPIFLLPGAHTFEAKKTGFVGANQSLELSAGAEIGVPLKLVPIAGGDARTSGAGGNVVDPDKKPPPPPPDRTLIYVGAAVSGGLLLAGIGTAVGAKIFEGRAVDAVNQVGCTGDAACKPIYEDNASKMQILAYTSLFSFIGAAAVGAVTVVSATGGKKPPSDAKQTPPKASFVVAPTLGGAYVQGVW